MKFSIIIPHFNIPGLLDRLLSTIPDDERIEVIVVDDKSNKDLDVLEQVKTKYANRNIIFLNNTGEKGAGNCRNLGVEKSTGDWCLFADADDYYTDVLFETLLKYGKSDYDVVAFRPTSFYVDTEKPAGRHLEICKIYNQFLTSPNWKNEIRARYLVKAPHSKMIRTKLIKDNHILFDGTMVANDVMFSAKSNYYANNFIVSEDVVYCITDREGSLTTFYDSKNMDIRIGVFIRRYHFLKENLKKNEFTWLHLSGLDFILLAMKYKQGIARIKELVSVFRNNKVKVIDFVEILKLIRLSTIKRIIGGQ